MASATTAQSPGSMTVPFLFQWEVLLAVVVVTMVLAVTVLVLWGTRPGAEDRAEWHAWLAARSYPERSPCVAEHPATGWCGTDGSARRRSGVPAEPC